MTTKKQTKSLKPFDIAICWDGGMTDVYNRKMDCLYGVAFNLSMLKKLNQGEL
jgi:hypothetical protein